MLLANGPANSAPAGTETAFPGLARRRGVCTRQTAPALTARDAASAAIVLGFSPAVFPVAWRVTVCHHHVAAVTA